MRIYFALKLFTGGCTIRIQIISWSILSYAFSHAPANLFSIVENVFCHVRYPKVFKNKLKGDLSSVRRCVVYTRMY